MTVHSPSGTRLILASDGLLETWGSRTGEGYAIRVEWGARRPEGWYEPTFSIDRADSLMSDLVWSIADALAEEYGSEPAAHFVTKRWQHLLNDRPDTEEVA